MLLAKASRRSALVITVLVMTRIEKRSFADYGLPGREAFGKRFWQGVPYGFAMLTLLMGLIAALHGFSFGGRALAARRRRALRPALFGRLQLVAIFEEFSFRGYMQATLASGIGFWPAAILLAVVFGAIASGEHGRSKIRAADGRSVWPAGSVLARRTGNIWFAIGMHAAWDWGETYFYAVPDSGTWREGHLLNSSFHGPAWLTGGTVGPEGSVFVFRGTDSWLPSAFTACFQPRQNTSSGSSRAAGILLPRCGIYCETAKAARGWTAGLRRCLFDKAIADTVRIGRFG